MKTEFLSKFLKDVEKINDKSVKHEIKETIINAETAGSMKGLINLKKLKGYKIAYRIKIGNYRIGVFIEGNTIEFARVVHRKDIYKLFP